MLPIVGGLATNDHERRARALKRDRARRRFEQRNARLQREEEHKQAERLARTKRAAPLAAVPIDAAQAAQDAAIKKAKINVAMSRAQLHKSLKAFGHPPTFEQQSQLIVLQQQFEAAEQEPGATGVNPRCTAGPCSGPGNSGRSDRDAELKRAKIQLAMRRAGTEKSSKQRSIRRTDRNPAACTQRGQQALHAAEALSEQPLPDLARVEKRPIDSQLRQLKTELAYARADVSKLERRADTPAEQMEKARARLLKPSVRCKPMPPLDAVDDRLQQAMQLVLLATLPGTLVLFWLYGWGCSSTWFWRRWRLWQSKRRLLSCASAPSGRPCS